MEIGTEQGYVAVESLIPLFQTFGRLHLEVDVKVHNLQMCTVGYKAMHEHILREEVGSQAYSVSCTDRDWWVTCQRT